MASPSLCAGDPVDFYANHKYFYEQDAVLGPLVPELEKRGIAESAEGFSNRVQPILEPYLNQLDVRLCITLGPDPHHCFVLSLEPGQKDRIIVQILSPGSQVELTENSHLDSPESGRSRGAPAANGFLEVPAAALKKGGRPVPIQMDAGGL
ncbi:hypothetical protein ACHAPT_009159 [Fusarium lateritium]